MCGGASLGSVSDIAKNLGGQRWEEFLVLLPEVPLQLSSGMVACLYPPSRVEAPRVLPQLPYSLLITSSMATIHLQRGVPLVRN